MEEIASRREASLGGTSDQDERGRGTVEGNGGIGRHERYAGRSVRMLLGQLRLAVRGHDRLHRSLHRGTKRSCTVVICERFQR